VGQKNLKSWHISRLVLEVDGGLKIWRDGKVEQGRA
jgi:hypothetical protein